MKRNTYIFMKRVVSLGLVIAMLSGIINAGEVTINAKRNSVTQDYIIVATNEKAYNRILSDIDKYMVEDIENLSDTI